MKLIRQKTYKDCGVACVAMLVNYYYKTELDLDFIKQQSNLKDEQLSFYNIIDIANEFKIKGEAFEVDMDFEELKNKTPFIAQVINEENISHFVVVENLTELRVVILDPSCNNKKRYTFEEFISIFQNNVLLFKPNKKAFNKEYKLHWFTFKNLLSLETTLYIFISLILSILIIFETRIIKLYSSTFTNENQNLIFYSFFIMVFILNLIFKNMSEYFIFKFYEKNNQVYIKKLTYYIANNNEREFYIIYNQISWMSKFESLQITSLISSLFTNVFTLIYIGFILKEALIILLIINIIIVIIILNKNKVHIFKKEQSMDWLLILNNPSLLKNLGKENEFYEKMNNYKPMNKSQLFSTSINFLEKCSFLIIYFICWSLIKDQTLDFNSFFIILLLKSFNKSFLITFYHFNEHWQTYKTYKIKYLKLFTNQKQGLIIDKIQKVMIYEKKKNTQIMLITNQTNQIQNINLKLLNKTFEQPSVDIFINNVNIKKIDSSSLRSKIIYIKELCLTYSTIFQNITNKNKTSIDIFTNLEIKSLLQKYNIKLEKIVEPNCYTNIEAEFIQLMSIFFNKADMIILDTNFKIITKEEIKSVIKLFHELFSDKFLILP
ncbi:ABC transporter ATP-binding protein/permease [Entomoplasma ellychniae]|uniref:ABC transporter ATP-binding protein/permease n=1 Tax=Entomoplasma ellychniae TaxID=2114 RepID=A0A8E2UAC9_9MOLU|nr:cysteine peptidase family C39 domain-containing protein [Entomoplasma ellychniae]PPE05054.1 ABC transporter ATP-binding protein/permease [Entomoplasma ellychniae]